MGIEKNTLVTTPTPVMMNHGEKPEKFNEAPALKEDETDKQVVAAIEAWKHADFLCHLIVRLRIEEDNRAFEKKAGKTFTEARANVVEQGQNSKKRKNPSSGPKQSPNDNKKFKGKCYVCDKSGHRVKHCRKRKDQGNTSKKPENWTLSPLMF
ncbi:hypothetical protein AAC387_Pa12g1208 [Persea americana]